MERSFIQAFPSSNICETPRALFRTTICQIAGGQAGFAVLTNTDPDFLSLMSICWQGSMITVVSAVPLHHQLDFLKPALIILTVLEHLVSFSPAKVDVRSLSTLWPPLVAGVYLG